MTVLSMCSCPCVCDGPILNLAAGPVSADTVPPDRTSAPSWQRPDPVRPAIGGAKVMAVTRLDLTDFRNYAGLRLDVDSCPVVLTGPNGAGKTNLLEALSFLAPGRGLRRASLGDIARAEPGQVRAPGRPWAVAARFTQAGGPAASPGRLSIGTGLVPAGPGGRARRTLRIDGEPVTSQAALAAIVRVIWLTPEMDGLFQEGAAARLRFIDRLVCGFDPGHAARAAAYSQAMRERARLLRDGIRDDIWLGSVEQRLAEHGVAIAAARRDTVSRLRAAGHIPPPFPAAGLALVGELEDWLDEAPALAVEDRLRAALAACRGRDGQQGGTGHGPHRCDLAVHHLDKDAPAARCSTGEQKAMLIAIMLAYARLQAVASGAPPLLLLDEVVAHLDAPRRTALFGHIGALGAQAWLTGTDNALFEPLRGRALFLRIESAAIAPEN